MVFRKLYMINIQLTMKIFYVIIYYIIKTYIIVRLFNRKKNLKLCHSTIKKKKKKYGTEGIQDIP